MTGSRLSHGISHKSSSLTRTRASLFNLFASTGGQAVNVILNFICRRYLIMLLGDEYMGLGSLFGHIMSFLSLIEPGFTAAVVFAYYRPIAEGDITKQKALNAFLEKTNLICAFLTVLAGVSIMPYLGRLIDIPAGLGDVRQIFLLTVINLASGYLFSARRAYLFARMLGFLTTFYHTFFAVIFSALRIVILARTKSYATYIASGIILGIVEDMVLHILAGRWFPALRDVSPRLRKSDTHEIKRQVGALFFHRLGSIITGSCDNLAIMTFMGLSAGTLYSNYTMIANSVMAFISLAAGSVSSALGNLGASDGGERMYGIWKKATICILFASLIITPSLFFAYPIVIRMWLGEGYILDRATTFLLCVSFFILANRSVLLVFRDALGLYKKELLKPFAEVAVNLPLTLFLVPRFGIKGAIIGQGAGMLVCLIWEYLLVSGTIRSLSKK